MRIRRNVYSLPAGDTTLDWYGRAITDMRKRSKTDALGWEYQGAVHGIAPVPAAQLTFWAQCQHASSFFLPWHRMYLLHFERIVAKHVQALGGPANWALPYWNYSQPGEDRLPPAFRGATLANGAANPLYEARRYTVANLGGAFMQAKDWDVTKCLKAPGGTAPGDFFGAAPSAHFGIYGGALESTPHNAIHNRVGAGGGLMADPDTAALDPIFWLHHGNIDRLWEVWLTRDPAHSNLSTVYWLSGVAFDFHDHNGVVVTMRSVDVLNLTAPALDYSYDDTSDPLAAAPPVLVAMAPSPGAPGGPGAPVTAPGAGELVGATLAGVQLGSNVEHVALPTPVSPHAFRASRSPSAMVAPRPARQLVRRAILQLEHVTSSSVAPTYDVYVNVPDGEDPLDREDRFVGRAAMFGIAQASDPKGAHGGTGQDFAFDITDLYLQLADDKKFDTSKLRVSFVPVEPEGGPQVTVGRVSLYFE